MMTMNIGKRMVAVSHESEQINACIVVKGRVQGVGFRATTQRIALSMKLAGTVRNLPDQAVEIWVQGSKIKIQQFLELVRKETSGEIFEMQISHHPLVSSESSFQIIF